MNREKPEEKLPVFHSEDFSRMSVGIEKMGKKGFLFKETVEYPESLEFQEDYSSEGYMKVSCIEGIIDDSLIHMVRIQRFLTQEEGGNLLAKTDLESMEFPIGGPGTFYAAGAIFGSEGAHETRGYNNLLKKFEEYEKIACGFCKEKLYNTRIEELEDLLPFEYKNCAEEISGMIEDMKNYGYDETKGSDYDYGKKKNRLESWQEGKKGNKFLMSFIFPVRRKK